MPPKTFLILKSKPFGEVPKKTHPYHTKKARSENTKTQKNDTTDNGFRKTSAGTGHQTRGWTPPH